LFFGTLKDVAGRAEDDLEAEEGWRLENVVDHYARLYPRLGEMKSSVALARNQRFSSPAELLSDGDEVAFLPPVSGGSGRYVSEVADSAAGHFFALTRLPIDVKALAAIVLRGEDGAVVNFEGVVRNNTRGRRTLYLEYEGYEPMAIRTMARIGQEIAETYPIGRIAMVHRLGRLEIGETSVAVVVSAPHRKAAFEAALEGIDRLKRLVPIWKKEHFADGETWAEGEWDQSVVKW
jgi:molybdopterin synthase catalytic subunit